MATHAQLEEAKQYINYGIKEGWLNEESFENLSDDEFVRIANDIRGKGDIEANEIVGEKI